jgi:4-amino-4-deoxy-L-arabinose transferase-like glycosyltransferase
MFRWNYEGKSIVTFAAVIIIASLFIAFQSFDISTYPLVHSDQALLNDPGLQLLTTGRFRSDLLSQNPGSEEHYFWQPPGLALTAALSYSIFGFGIWQTRLPSIVFGAAALVVLFLLVRFVSNKTLPAALVTLLLFSWPNWVLTSKDARMDTAAIFFLLVSTLLLFRAIDVPNLFQPVRIFVSGLAASAAAFFHPAAFTWFASLVCVIAVFSSARKIASISIFCLGSSIIIGAWLLYGLYYAPAFEAQFVTNLINRTHEGGVISAIPMELARYLRELMRFPAFFPMAFIATGKLWTSKIAWTRRFKLLALTWMTLAVLNALLAGKQSGFYTLYPFVLLLSLISIGIAEFWNPQTPASKWQRILVAIVCVGFVLNSAAFAYGPRVLAFAWQSKERNYAKQFRKLSELLRPGDQVWGSAAAWYAVVSDCARLDSQPESVPFLWRTFPVPERHRFIVTEPKGQQFVGFKKLGVFGSDLPLIFGSRLSNAPYLFELWESNEARHEPSPPINRAACPALATAD